jgi:NADH dehydrogenase
MNDKKTAVVTGAFSYQGKYITRLLLEKGYQVRTLTGHPDRKSEFGDRVEAVPFHFDEPARLVEDLADADLFINTYWVRFNYGDTTYGRAVANTQNLMRAAKEAGVRRFVHVSITNPSLESPYAYFSGKAIMEQTLMESCLSFAVIRPTVLFGREDILINNIAWLLRKSPVFGVFGKGDYRIQPVYVGDVAEMAVELGEQDVNIIVDAVGPETYAFSDLVRMIRGAVGSRSRIVNVPPLFAWAVGRLVSPLVRDVVITWDEILGLMSGLLVSDAPPTCEKMFSEWIVKHADELGSRYASELLRHYR